MVVGKGMLASAFSDFADDESQIIFASGVANSGETSVAEFQREVDLINSFSSTQNRLIYFSTVSIYDPELGKSAYVIHKKNIEELIRSAFSNYLILRLPIVVGKTSNPHTLTNYLFNKIKSGETVTVFSTACRYIMDIDDIRTIVSGILYSGSFKNETLNINFNNAVKSEELISLFEKVLHTKANKVTSEKGGCYTPDNSKFISYLKEINFILPNDYIELVLKKYYSI